MFWSELQPFNTVKQLLVKFWQLASNIQKAVGVIMFTTQVLEEDDKAKLSCVRIVTVTPGYINNGFFQKAQKT